MLRGDTGVCQVGDMLGDMLSPMTPGAKFLISGPAFRLILVYV